MKQPCIEKHSYSLPKHSALKSLRQNVILLLLLLSGKTRNCSGLPVVKVIEIIELQRSILFL